MSDIISRMRAEAESLAAKITGELKATQDAMAGDLVESPEESAESIDLIEYESEAEYTEEPAE